MATVSELTPGVVVRKAGMAAIYVARTDHPLYHGLQLVIWRLEGGWSHDALRADQDVGDIDPSTTEQRIFNLRNALLGRQ